MTDLIKADGTSYYLFRGETRLPRGVIPLSPFMRMGIRQGYTIEQVIDRCIDHAQGMAYTREGFPHEYVKYSEFNLPDNPYVSTTESLAVAAQYATEAGYVSIFKLEERRISRLDLGFRSQEIHSDIADFDREYIVLAAISPDEIVFQIPVSDLYRFIPRSELKNSSALNRLLAAPGLSSYRFNPVDPPGVTCPYCRNELSYYLTDILGDRSSRLDLATGYSESHLDWLVRFGKIARCGNCRRFVINREIAHQVAVQVDRFWQRGDEIHFEVSNRTHDQLYRATVAVSYVCDGRLQSNFFIFELRQMTSTMNALGVPGSLKNRLDRRLGPQSTDTWTIRIEDMDSVRDVQIFEARFDSGRLWVPLDLPGFILDAGVFR